MADGGDGLGGRDADFCCRGEVGGCGVAEGVALGEDVVSGAVGKGVDVEEAGAGREGADGFGREYGAEGAVLVDEAEGLVEGAVGGVVGGGGER